MSDVVPFPFVRMQHERLADTLRGNIDAETTIAAVSDLFLADADFMDHLRTLPDDLRDAVTKYGRERLYALGYPRPRRERA